jgi:predicted GIY-YIG superfamily endonuclease
MERRGVQRVRNTDIKIKIEREVKRVKRTQKNRLSEKDRQKRRACEKQT